MTMNRPRCGKPLRKYSRPGQEPVPATERVCWIPEGHPPDTRCMSKEAYERHITQVAARKLEANAPCGITCQLRDSRLLPRGTPSGYQRRPRPAPSVRYRQWLEPSREAPDDETATVPGPSDRITATENPRHYAWVPA